jgi:hypothetical protein
MRRLPRIPGAARDPQMLALVDDAGVAVDKLRFVCQMLLCDNVSLSDQGVSGMYYVLMDVADSMAALVAAL